MAEQDESLVELAEAVFRELWANERYRGDHQESEAFLDMVKAEKAQTDTGEAVLNNH